MKKMYLLCYLLAAILFVLLLMWIWYPHDRYVTAEIAAYLCCVAGAAAFVLVYLGLYFADLEKQWNVAEARAKAREAAHEATLAELERLEKELAAARRDITDLKELNERFEL